MYFLYLLYPLIFGIDDAAAVVIAGIIAALASTATAVSSRKAQKDANAANIHIAQMNNEANAANIDKMNEYNSPASQVARLSAAGLNPNLVYGNGQVMNTQDTPATFTAPHISPAGFDFSAIGDAGNSMIDNFLKFRATDISQQNANSNTQNANTLMKEAEIKRQEMLNRKENMEVQNKVWYATIDNLKLDKEEKTEYLKLYPQFLEQQLEGSRLANQKTSKDIEEAESRIFVNKAQKEKFEAETRKYIEEVLRIIPAQAASLSSQAGLYSSQIPISAEQLKDWQNKNKNYFYYLDNLKSQTQLNDAKRNLTEKQGQRVDTDIDWYYNWKFFEIFARIF